MRLAIVTPRYGRDVVGGAEAQARGFAEEGARRGWYVEVWTSCAKSHYTWENVYAPGAERTGSLTVRRFPITMWDPDRNAELDGKLALNGRLSHRDELAWLESGAHSVPLYSYVEAHSSEFDVVLCMPYTSPLVHSAAWLVRGARRVVIPCLHDEPYAYMQIVRLLLETSDGVMFLSPEEGGLALRRLGMNLPYTGVVGGGIESPVAGTQLSRGLDNSPYLLYVGRLEGGKNLSLLYDCVQACREKREDLRLMVIGRGPYEPPKGSAFEFRGYVTEQERNRAYAAALALCQPSVNESFSMTIMESWLRGTPVLVHSDCSVTVGHVRRSSGGLYFQDCPEFAAEVEWLLSHRDLALRMGVCGRQYVLANYTWSAVLGRFHALLIGWGHVDV